MFEKLQEKLKDLTTEQQQVIESALVKAAEEIVSSPAFSKAEVGYWTPKPGELIWIWHRPSGYAYSANYMWGRSNDIDACVTGVCHNLRLLLDGNIHRTREDAVQYGEVYNAKRKYIALARKSFGKEGLDWSNPSQDKVYAVVDSDKVSYMTCYQSNHMTICFSSQKHAEEATKELGLEMMKKIADFLW